jgi:hypothetical protein
MNRYAASALVLALMSSACASDDLGPQGSYVPPVGGGNGGTSGAGSGSGGTTAGTGGGSGAGTSGAGGTAGTFDMGGEGGTGNAGTGDLPMCVNSGETNFDCPFSLPPIMGSCAPAGECCHRTSNTARIAALGADDPEVLEYRLEYVEIYNHPQSIGLPDLVRTANQRADVCAGEQCLLWRFTAPRQGGQTIAGMGEVEIGVGAYNCDGTYSYYGPNAASDRTAEIGESDPGRWQSVKVPAVHDPAKEGVERFHIPFGTNKNREVARSLFLFPADNTLDWELASSGFNITSFDTSPAGQDCMGEREGFGWNAVAGFVSYSPLKGNDKDISNQINQTYCALLAFGLLPEGQKNKDCFTTERCLPDGGNFGDGGCDWLKVPDSLCPETEDDRALYGCHLGAEGNPNEETDYPTALSCTPTAPAEPLDPDTGATSDGQCCDPLGVSATLPACNAYRTVGRFVAASAEITDAPRDTLPPVCM